MKPGILSTNLNRRTVIKTAAAAGVLQIASPFVIPTWAADEVKIGLDNPLTSLSPKARITNGLIGGGSKSVSLKTSATESTAKMLNTADSGTLLSLPLGASRSRRCLRCGLADNGRTLSHD